MDVVPRMALTASPRLRIGSPLRRQPNLRTQLVHPLRSARSGALLEPDLVQCQLDALPEPQTEPAPCAG